MASKCLFPLAVVFAFVGYFVFLWFRDRSVQDRSLFTMETKLVVVTNRYKENIQWLYEKVDAPIVVCQKTDTVTGATCDTENLGREASSYLKFILQNYDRLPRYVAFLHGHETAWHQRENIVQRLNRFAAESCPKGYITLNNNWIWNTEGNSTVDLARTDKLGYSDVWGYLFQEELGPAPTEDAYFDHDCCAQFIVSREAILRHDKKSYQKWYDFLMQEPKNTWRTILFEHVWHMIFGEPMQRDREEYYKDFETCFT